MEKCKYYGFGNVAKEIIFQKKCFYWAEKLYNFVITVTAANQKIKLLYDLYYMVNGVKAKPKKQYGNCCFVLLIPLKNVKKSYIIP